jgi:hypothetical protein
MVRGRVITTNDTGRDRAHAYSAGDVTLVVIAQISSGRVFAHRGRARRAISCRTA